MTCFVSSGTYQPQLSQSKWNIFVASETVGEISRCSLGKVHWRTLYYVNYILCESYMTRNVYWSHASVCVSVCPSPHSHRTDLDVDVTLGNGRGCPLVVHCWADLQSVYGFHCYDNIALNMICQQVLVLSLCLVVVVMCILFKICHIVWYCAQITHIFC